jgi:recombination protein RecT
MATETEKGAEAGTAKKKTTPPPPVGEKSVVDIVSEKVTEFLKSGQLDLPTHYSVDNALKAAYLLLNTVEDKDKNKVMIDGKLTGVCTKASIANAVLDMVIQGLNPTKKQCYFIVYGKSLACHRSYFGSMAVAEMVNPLIKDWGYNVVYDGDVFKFGILNGKASVIEHSQDLDNIDKVNIRAAYAMALDKEGKPIKTEIMTIEEIHQAWSMSKTSPFNEKGELRAGSTHGKFTRDMALRTVINKVAKFIINASSDNALLLERINRSEELADAAAVQAEIEGKANTGTLLMIPEEQGKTEEAGDKEAREAKEVKSDPAAALESGVGTGEGAKPQVRGPAF